MKKLLLALIMVASATISFAQSNQAFPQKTYWASDYGTWQVHGQIPNTYQFQPASLCAFPQPSGGTFNAFNINGPVYLEDATPANSELLTPTSVLINESICQVSLMPTHTHYSFNLMSGTAGLQEVLNVISSNIPYATQVILDRNWYTAVNSIPTQTAAGVIASVKGNTSAILVDNTKAPSTYYTWNGTQYVAVSSGGGANFPNTPGVVYNTSNSASENASSSQVATVLNTSPSTTLVPGVLPLATSGAAGIVKPDGTTTTVSGSGVISASQPSGTQNQAVMTPNGSSGVAGLRAIVPADLPTATSSTLGVVQPDNSTITISGGVISSTSGGTATFPNTNGLVCNTSTSASRTCAANTDYMPAIAESNYGYSLVSTGSGNAYSPQAVPLSFGGTFTQYVEQPTSDANWTTLAVNNLNNIFYPEGYAGGAYSGIGQAPVAWTVSTGNVGIGQVVTYSGGNYICVQANNSSVTPGSNPYFWMPVPNAAASTSGDVAYYSAEAYKHFAHVSPTVQLGAATYNSAIGWQDYVDGNSYDDEFAVNVKGCGIDCSFLNYTGSTAIPQIQRPTSAGNYAYLEISDVTIEGNYTASSNLDLGKLNQTVLRNLHLTQIAVGSDHHILVGYTGGDGFQVFQENVLIDDAVNAQPNAGVFTANIVGGSVTSYTVNTSGAPYYSEPCAGGYTCYVSLLGYQGGTKAQPCTVMPVGQVVTLSGSGVASISEGTNSGGSGCVGPIDVQVFQTIPVNYGEIWNASDSTIKDLTIYSGVKAGLLDNGGSVLRLHVHPSVINVGIIANGVSGQYINTECDTIFSYCFEINQPYVGNSAAISGTTAYYPWLLPGAAPYLFNSSTDQVNISNSASLCGDGGKPTDYHEFVGQSGVIDTAAQYLTRSPTGLIVTGNDLSCPSLPGDFIPTLTVQNFSDNGNALATLGNNNFTGIQSVANFMTISGATSEPALSIGGSSYQPNGNTFNMTSDYAYGTILQIDNTSGTPNDWGLISAGVSTGLTSALGFSNGTYWPWWINVNSATPQMFVPSGGEIAFSTSSTGPSGTGQNAGFSSPSSGVISADSTTAGNSAATFKAVIPVADLNGGTGATSTTYWRGDGTWATPPGSGASGTVSSGTAWSPTFYAATGTTVSGTTPFTGFEYWPGSGAPQAATPSNLLSLVGYYTGAYSSGTTYKFNDIAADGSGNNYISLSAGNVGNALTNATYWHFLGGVSTTITGGNCTSANQFVTSISTTGVPTCSGLGVALTSPTTITSTSFVTTGLALPSIPVSSTTRGHCSIIWEQSTATNTVQFGAGNSSTPTDLYTMSTLHSGASGGTSTDQYTTITSTTTTAISATGAPGATATGYKEEIDLTLVNSATGADVVTIYALTGSGSDAVVIEPGSSCEWLP